MKNNLKNRKQTFSSYIPPEDLGKVTNHKKSYFAYLFTARSIFMAFILIGIIISIVDAYKFQINMPLTLTIVLVFSVIFHLLLRLLPHFIGIGSVVLASTIYVLVNFSKIATELHYFWNLFLYNIDSRLLNTMPLMDLSVSKLLRSPVPNYATSSVIYIGIIIAFIIVLLNHSRFAPTVTLTLFAAILVPGFASENVNSSYGCIWFLAGFIALHAQNLSAQQMQRYMPISKHRKRFSTYDYFSGTAIMGCIVVTTLMVSLVISIPANFTIDYTKITDKLIEVASNVAANISDTFNIDLGFIRSSNYFSIDSGTINSNKMDINAPTTDNTPVLRCTMSDVETPIYLTGDIGSNFDGEKWNSITANKLDFGDYYPEMEFFTFMQYLLQTAPDPNLYMGFQNIHLEYLKNTKIVFLPTFSSLLNYKNNELWDNYGDSVLRMKGNTGLGSMDNLTIYPKMNAEGFSDFAHNNNRLAHLGKYTLSPEIKYSFSDIGYKEARKKYMQYIFDTYTKKVPESERANIDKLFEVIGNYSMEKYGINMLLSGDRFASATTIVDYFKDNFDYSLTVNNKEGGNTYLGNFLFNTKSGHCALFATATTLLLQDRGIPARYVTGYVTPTAENGNYSKILFDGATCYTREILAKELHAWVEVYIDGAGWLPFDPTSGGIATDYTPAASSTTTHRLPNNTSAKPTTTMPKITTGSTTEVVTENKVDVMSIITISVVAVLLILIVLFLILYRYHTKKMFQFFKAGKSNKAVRQMYQYTLKRLRVKGFTKMDDELPMDFAARVDKNTIYSGSELTLSEIMPIFEEALFSKNKIADRIKVHEYVLQLMERKKKYISTKELH